ncbi:cysteine desulfurase family protein [Pyxidicoccus xibeiensis]|uniref:cysteine desulfurase family protein n=1 Tax=Pyxidicoccus xibeiensis TaxID=2906759 RepID=UPI0020A77D7B|nr:cysteine desulfurase family protein [Pyxidicoccus xibeiensis]MCP3140293.1 cysteine desulfurase [Pyxidicoccus xibeiensis]
MRAPARVRGPIYLDHHATTPCDPRVVEAMLPYLVERFGSAGSRLHAYGWEAAGAVDTARARVASLLKAQHDEVVFTSGATESNNLALLGVLQACRQPRRHVVTTAIEHKSVLEPVRWLERQGCEVTVLKVPPDGRVREEHVRAVLRPYTVLVSVMHANNETGVLNDVAAIGRLCQEHGALFHTDAAQTCGKCPLDVRALHVDLLSLSGHKLYAPKGIGALYVGPRASHGRLSPLLLGGGQESGLRAGTLPVHQLVALGEACELAAAELLEEGTRLLRLRTRLLAALTERLPGLHVNGDLDHRLPGNLNVSFEDVDGELLIERLQHHVAFSTCSACMSGNLRPSHVLLAMGVSEDLAHASLRLGLGRFTTQEEVDAAADHIVRAVIEARLPSARGNAVTREAARP